MKKQNCLTAREEELLHILWDMNEPLTAGKMVERLSAGGWNKATVFKTVQTLFGQFVKDTFSVKSF